MIYSRKFSEVGKSNVFFLPFPALVGQLTSHLNCSLIQPLIFQGQALGTDTCHDPLKTTRTAWESANVLQTDGTA